MAEGRRPDEPDWIDRLTRLAGALGMNQVRVRWKLQRLENRWEAWKRRQEQRVGHIRYEHKTCRECGHVQDREERVCTNCGAKLRARWLQVVGRIGLVAPQVVSVSGVLGTLMVLVYGRLILAGPDSGIVSMDVETMLRHGASFGPLVDAGQYWRWATSIFLHFGLWHLGFNLFALTVIGPHVEDLYGRWQMLFLFMLTGVLASIGSDAMRDPWSVSAGASGGMMGLIGVAAGWGQRAGTRFGRSVRNDMLKWVAYTFLFGLFIGADHWAHGFGFAAGAVWGYAVRPEQLRGGRMRAVRIAMAGVGALSVGGSVYLAMAPPPLDEPAWAVGYADETAAEMQRRAMAPLLGACERLAAGDETGAVELVREGWELDDADTEMPVASLRGLCGELELDREACRQGQVVTQRYPHLQDELDVEGRRALERQWRLQCQLLLE